MQVTAAALGKTSLDCCWSSLPFTGQPGNSPSIEAPSSALTLSKRRSFALVGSAILVQTALMRVGFTFGDSIAARMSQAPFTRSEHLELRHSLCSRCAAGRDVSGHATRVSHWNRFGSFCRNARANGMQKALYAMVSCAAAVYGIGRYRERQSVTLAGLLIGGVNILMAFALIAYAEQPLTLNTILVGHRFAVLQAVF